MKKLTALLLCVGLLAGCSSSGYDVKIKDSSDVLVSGEGLNITKQEYFEDLLDKYGATKIMSEILDAIADKEITDTKEINTALAKKKKTYASYSDGDLKAYAQSVGYESEEKYIEEVLLPEVKQELLRKKYIKENYKSLLKDYQVVRFKKITVDKESTALKIIKASTNETAFDKQMKKYNSSAEDSGIVNKNSTLDDNLKKKLEKLSQITKDGVYKDAIKLSDDKYAVIFIYDTKRKNQNEYIESLSNDQDIKEEIEGKYLKKYNFEVYDSKLKKAIKELSSQYIE